ncbi:MAG TPA: 50S ribosomal protein L11 methyltransferase [Acidimicrobiales bacterium]|nr:50S ribosomal protein L11 methyltransferase [Acidimicrobiales bacterium]
MENERVVRWEVDAARAEVTAFDLWDHGATAVEIRDAGAVTTLVASFPTTAAAESVARQLGAVIEAVDPAWSDAWKAHAAPVDVAGSLVVAPAWRPVPVGDGRLVLEIDPGRCFGSGSHPSTRLVLGLLVAQSLAGHLLDVGTGSGILAVAAARLGAATVTAVDVEPEAVEVARRNAARNGVEARVHPSLRPVEEAGGPFDGALVNVTAGVHAVLGAAVVRAVRPGGRLYLAGLLPGQWEHVAGAYAGCRLLERPVLDGWVGAVLERGG